MTVVKYIYIIYKQLFLQTVKKNKIIKKRNFADK